MTRAATLRVAVGPGERTPEGYFRIHRVDFRETYPVGETSPDAWDLTRLASLVRVYPVDGELRFLLALARHRLGRDRPGLRCEFTVDFVGITVGELPVVRVTERSSATGGVEKANLTGFGTITVNFPTLRFTLEVEYDGVMCP